MKKVEARYTESLMDKSKCVLTFAIEAENVDGNVSEILSTFAKLSRSAYISLGNKMVYGTAVQAEIKQLATENQQPAVD